ncbi:MAG: helix-turn-helix domain-containing protein [Acidimicrobiales bacterium]
MASSLYVQHSPRRSLAGVLVCEWERPECSGRELLVAPDGCADLIWRSDGQLFVAGPDRSAATHQQAPGIAFVGLRLRPGTAGALLRHEVNELCDQLVPLSSLWGRGVEAIAEQLAAASTPAEQRSILARMLRQRTESTAVDRQVVAAASTLTVSVVPVHALPERVALGDRQLRRRFARQVGYGPKTFQRIMRFRRAVALYGHDGRDGAARACLAQVAVAAGYADQAHLTRECRRLTGMTPVQFLGGDGTADDAMVDDVVHGIGCLPDRLHHRTA